MTLNDQSDSSSRLHVLEIVGNAIVGGMENYVRNLIGHLPRERYRVSCLSPFESPFTQALRALDCKVYITPIADDPSWNSIQLAVDVIQRAKVDLIHAHMPKAHVVAMGVGGVPEVVEYGTTGYVTPAGDIDHAAATIVKLLNDPARRRQMSWRRVSAPKQGLICRSACG